jgi:hypothetical protein
MDKKNWILQLQETRRNFNNSTWVPLRASQTKEKGSVKNIGFESDCFGCGSVAFLPEHVDKANDLSWSDIGISSIGKPYAYDDGHYSPIDQYECNDKEPIGVLEAWRCYRVRSRWSWGVPSDCCSVFKKLIAHQVFISLCV